MEHLSFSFKKCPIKPWPKFSGFVLAASQVLGLLLLFAALPVRCFCKSNICPTLAGSGVSTGVTIAEQVEAIPCFSRRPISTTWHIPL